MYESDSEPQQHYEELEQQFITHCPSQTQLRVPQPVFNVEMIRHIQQRCNQLQNSILLSNIEVYSHQVIRLAMEYNQILAHTNNNKQDSSKFKAIFPLIVSKNQAHFVTLFVQRIYTKLQQLLHEYKIKQQSSSSKQVESNLGLIKYKNSQISLIALKIHKYYTQRGVKQTKMLFITDQVTNLSPENIYILEEGLKQYNCILLIPTFYGFENANYYQTKDFQIVPFKMFANDLLFYEYMYQCIIDEQIKAYLPRQSLCIIRQFTQFPVSYSQGCRRLNFWIRKLHIYFLKKQRSLNFVSIGKLFDFIDQSFRENQKYFLQFTHQLKMKNRLKSISCILDERQNYDILNSYISICYYNPNANMDDIIRSIRRTLLKAIKTEPLYHQYCDILQTNPYEIKRQIRVRKRIQDRYDIPIHKAYNQKAIFQQQLRRIIYRHTFKIRQQILSQPIFKLQTKYCQSIKPMVLLQIYKSIKSTEMRQTLQYKTEMRQRLQYRTKMRQKLQYFARNCSIRMVQIIQDTVHSTRQSRQQFYRKQSQRQSFGKNLFIVKQLQLYGMIAISSTTLINPKIVSIYYPKACFWRHKPKLSNYK